MSVEDQHTLSLWQGSIVQDSDNHYVLPIPFRGECVLPNSLPLAQERLFSLHRRLLKNPVLHQCYVDSMKGLLEEGHVEEVMVNADVQGPIWYLPPHPVISPQNGQSSV